MFEDFDDSLKVERNQGGEEYGYETLELFILQFNFQYLKTTL